VCRKAERVASLIFARAAEARSAAGSIGEGFNRLQHGARHGHNHELRDPIPGADFDGGVPEVDQERLDLAAAALG